MWPKRLTFIMAIILILTALGGCKRTPRASSTGSPSVTPKRELQQNVASREEAMVTYPQANEPLNLAENLGTRSQGVDWPGVLGPSGDGKSPKKGVKPWPASGPK